jgi:hypothetical protein
MPEITEQQVVEAEGQAMAANAVVMTAITDAMFGNVSAAAAPIATRYIPVTIDGVDYLLLAKLAP